MKYRENKYSIIMSFVVAGFMLLCLHSLRGQEPEVTAISVVDAFELEKTGLHKAPRLSGALFSPDRNRLAIPFPDSIAIVDTTGEILQIVDLAEFGVRLRGRLYDWSLDDRLLFVGQGRDKTERGYTPHCYTYALATKELFIVDGLGNARFSPDGAWIAGYRTDKNNHPSLWLIRSNGTDERMLASVGSSNPEWSHNGEMIGYTKSELGEVSLWAYDFEFDTHQKIYSPIAFPFCRFSPDDKFVCYTAEPTKGLSIATVTGKHMQSLVPSPERIVVLDFEWSLDGTKIAFVMERSTGEVIENSEIYVIDADGTDLKKITTTPDIIKNRPHWMSNNTIVYIPR